MRWSLAALLIGFGLDLLLGDPRGVPHPVALIGKLISALERMLRRSFPQTAAGERWAGGVLWVLTAGLSLLIPALLLWACRRVSPWLALAAESVMSWQILAVRSLREESMKVYTALESGDLEASRRAVSWIVGRDTERLDEAGVARAAVETVAENTSDGVVAPLFFLALGGAPLGFFYKAVNTMDSMLGYVEPPYRNIGLVPAKMDDVLNFLPARLAALLMLAAGGLLGLDVGGGWRIFRRDRHNHASPNSAQTESVCAGLLGLRPDDPRLPDSFALAAQRGMQFSIHPVELRSAHPNTAVLTLTSRTGRQLSLKAASVGGGRIRVTEIDGVPADFGGDSNTLIIHNEDTPGCIAEVTMALALRRINIASMQVFRAAAGGYAVMVLECDSHIPHALERQLAVMPGLLKVTCLNVDEPEETEE